MYFWEQTKLFDERASGRLFFRGVDEALRGAAGNQAELFLTENEVFCARRGRRGNSI